jgi:hypothetical protein
MWSGRKKELNKIQMCADLLSSAIKCKAAMIRAVSEYPISAAQHLTKPTGRRPWIGQAACCVEIGATEEEVRIAWNFYMNPEQQEMANKIADKVINDWEFDNA